MRKAPSGSAICALILLALAPAFYLHEALLDSDRVLIAADAMAAHPPWQADWGRAQNLELSDHAHSWIPWSSFLADEVVHRARVPLWNPYQFCGSPALGNPQFGHFDVFGMPLHAAFGSVTSALNAFEWGALLRLVLAGSGAYLLALRLGRSRIAALLAGAIYAYGGFQVLWLLYPLAHVACWLPWVLWAVDKSQREGSRLATACMAIFLALAVLGGHPETGFFVGCGAGLWALAGGLRCWRDGAGARPLLAALLALAAGALLGAPALVPFVEYLGESSIDAVRAKRDLVVEGVPLWLLALRVAAFGVALAVAALDLGAARSARRIAAGALVGAALALLFCAPDAGLYPQLLVDPGWLGDPRTDSWRGPATYLESNTAFVGALALALAAAGWTARPRGGTRGRAVFAGLALLALLAGRGIAPFDTLLHEVPPFSFVELTRGHVLANLALALLAALGLDGLLDAARGAARARWLELAAPIATLLALALAGSFALPDQERIHARDAETARSQPPAPEAAAADERILEPLGIARSGSSGIWIRARVRAGVKAVAHFEPLARDAAAIERALVPSSADPGILEHRLSHLELPNGAYDLSVRFEDEHGTREQRGGRILWGLQGGPLSPRGSRALLGVALLVLVLGAATSSGFGASARTRWALGTAVLAAVIFELWCFGATWNPSCAKAPIYRSTPSLEFLQAKLREARARGDGEFRIWAATGVLPPNAATGLRLRDVRGYDAIETSRWQLVQQALLLHPSFRSPLLQTPASPAQLDVASFPVEVPFFRMLGVRYVLDSRRLEPEILAARGLRLAFPAASDVPPKDGVYVYEAAGADGRRAFLCTKAIGSAEASARFAAGDFAILQEPRSTLLLDASSSPPPLAQPMQHGSVHFELDEPDHLVLRLDDLDGEAWLGLMDSAFPGWEAEIDGVTAPIEIAHHAFRAVRLPAGAKRAEFHYRPRSLELGLGLAGAGILLALFSCASARRQSRVRP